MYYSMASCKHHQKRFLISRGRQLKIPLCRDSDKLNYVACMTMQAPPKKVPDFGGPTIENSMMSRHGQIACIQTSKKDRDPIYIYIYLISGGRNSKVHNGTSTNWNACLHKYIYIYSSKKVPDFGGPTIENSIMSGLRQSEFNYIYI